MLGPILGMRTSVASMAPNGPEGQVHGALGASFIPGPMSTFMPTITVDDSRALELAGIQMTVCHAYGDAQDEIDVWFPDLAHVHGSETIQGETFPNLYTLRGTSYRNLESWHRGVDALLRHAKNATSYSASISSHWPDLHG
ncbi:hypothetical protein [Rhodococcus jostii]|uniref:hypothetical protein n=1 Tax=Rhodococcus jostii TaxID=132919 RepID=UPI00363320D3